MPKERTQPLELAATHAHLQAKIIPLMNALVHGERVGPAKLHVAHLAGELLLASVLSHMAAKVVLAGVALATHGAGKDGLATRCVRNARTWSH